MTVLAMRTAQDARRIMDTIERMARAAKASAVPAEAAPGQYGFAERRRFLAKLDEARALLVMARGGIAAAPAVPGWRAGLIDGLDRLEGALTVLALEALIGFVDALGQRDSLPLGTRPLLERERRGLDELLSLLDVHGRAGRIPAALIDQAMTLTSLLDRLIAEATDLPDFDAGLVSEPEPVLHAPTRRLMGAVPG